MNINLARIPPDVLGFLKRKKDDEAMSERLPNGTPAINVGLPSLVRRLLGDEEPKSPPIIRMSDVQQTDALPPAQNLTRNITLPPRGETLASLVPNVSNVSQNNSAPTLSRAPAPDVAQPINQPLIRLGNAPDVSSINARVSPPVDQPSRVESPPPTISRINEFAAPNVTALARVKQAPADDNTPRITLNPSYAAGQFNAPSLSRATQPSSQPVISLARLNSDALPPQDQTTLTRDVSTSPVEDRRSAILDQNAPAPNTTPDANSPAPNSRQAAAEARRQQLEDRLAKLLQLEGTKAVDKNGRVKSTFLGILRGYLKDGLGGAITGGIYGGVHPGWDEEIKQSGEILKERGKLKEAMEIENQLARLDAMQTRAGRNGSGLTTSQMATRRQSFYNFLTKNFPNGYQRGTRRDVDAELDRLQMDAPPAVPRKSGQGRGYVMSPGQVVAFPDGSGGFNYQVPHDEEGKDAPSMSESQKQMADADRRRIEIQLAELNLRRSRAHLKPVTFDDFLAGGGDTPVDAPQSTPSVAPAVTPVPQSRGQRPALVPSGAQPEVVPTRRGSNRRGRAAAGGVNQRDIGFAQSGAADAMARAAEARARGDEATAQAWEAKAEIENQRASRAGGQPVTRRQQSSVFQDLPGVPTARATAQAGAQQAGARQYTEKEIRDNAKANNLNPDAAVRFARQNGRLKRGN